MKIAVLASALVVASISVSHAATVTVVVGTASNVYTLTSLKVDGSGNVTVNASGGSSGGTTTPPADGGATTPPPDDDGAATPPDSGSGERCSATGNLKCITTNVPNAVYNAGTVTPLPAEVYAYAFTAPSGTAVKAGMAVATRTTAASASKLVVISTVAGDVSITGKHRACYAFSSETSSVQYVINYSTNSYCTLEPGKPYFVNVASVDMAGKATCTSALRCGHTFTLR